MSRRRVNTTKIEIIQVAMKKFLENGFSNTTAKSICEELDISTGNLTFYFPTKEHMLAVLVEMLGEFQWKMMEQLTDEGNSSLLALCLELPTIAAICEENEIAKDFYISAYSHPMTLDIIRRSDEEKAKAVFGEYCAGWTNQNFAEAEVLVSGIEYATLMTTSDVAPLDVRVAGALNSIMMIYNVPEEIRSMKVDKILAMDYRSIGRRILEDFKEYVEEVNEQALDDLIEKRSKNANEKQTE
ncbi:MAG: TetR/AcrR family transcriptional regulator [Clostridia bacterium]|nr:TetR/AcrR family transcriptional regulator [Clostridia bacterium]